MTNIEIYLDKLWNLNPNGNKNSLETTLKIASNRGIELEVIFNSYKAYLLQWQQSIGKRDPQYIGEKQQLKSVEEFTEKEEYKKSFALPLTDLDKEFGIDILGKAKLEEIYNKFEKKHNIPKS